MIELRSFELNAALLSPSIYGSTQCLWSSQGVVLPRGVSEGISELLGMLLRQAGVDSDQEGIFFRVDLYVDPAREYVYVLEANACFVDGWGTALSLSRAVGSSVDVRDGMFPKQWTLFEDVYQPEFELALRELRLAGAGDLRELSSEDVLYSAVTDPVYWYGRFSARSSHSHVWPYRGSILDAKTWIARTSWEWNGAHPFVRVPLYYDQSVCAWDELPYDVVFKPVNKVRDRDVVQFRRSIGRGKAVRRRYNQGEVYAQEIVPTLRADDGRPVQLVVMCVGTEPVAGYTLIAPSGAEIINDSASHGPLIFE